MGPFIYLVLSITLCLPVSARSSQHQIFLPPGPNTTFPVARASATLPNGMDELTVCFWARFIRPGQNTIFSYAQPKRDNEVVLAVIDGKQTNLNFWRIQPLITAKAIPVRKGKWFHGCATWSSYRGETSVYIDGKCTFTEEGLMPGAPIVAGGVVILGNDQDNVGGGFEAEAQFWGGLSGVNVWDRVLYADEVASLANCSSTEEGNIISWSRTWMGLYNGAEIGPVALPCQRETSCKSHESMTPL